MKYDSTRSKEEIEAERREKMRLCDELGLKFTDARGNIRCTDLELTTLRSPAFREALHHARIAEEIRNKRIAAINRHNNRMNYGLNQ